jgi:heat shock protein HtpX
MAMMKRLFLFMAVNILIVVTLSITLNLLGVRPYLHRSGIDYNSLMVFCLVWGMGGAFISLSISRIMAKWAMGVTVLEPEAAMRQGGDAAWLVQTVHKLSKQAGLPALPEVGIWESPEVNAFATGPTKSRALVAVSTGILQRMNRDELEGVLGHEVAHVANGDMVTMTLVQGVINAFVMFLARAIAFAVTQGGRDNERSSYGTRYMITMVLEIALSFLGMIVVAYFSRRREFRADAGGASLAGRQRMIMALQSLKRSMGLVDNSHASLATLKISQQTGFLALLSTHPSLDDRIAALQGRQ